MLLDVEDVTLGHTTKLRWNDSEKWIFSKQVVHPQLVDDKSFRDVQDMLAGRGRGSCEHTPHRSRHSYAFKGIMICGIHERKMRSRW